MAFSSMPSIPSEKAVGPLLALGLLLASQSAVADGEDLSVAQAVYQNNCARCHGATGEGDGRDAKRMFPRPRKLSEGVFKFRTTASGTPPTDQDLFNTLTQGLPGSRMPEFTRLPEETRWQLVHYVKSLSPIFKEQEPEPLNLGNDPGVKKASLHKGKELFASLGCVACHGNLGRGDGPSAAALVDNWGNSIRAADLTQGWNYRAGSAPREIVARLMAGIDGTPMPSYADAVSPEEAWHLAYYVQSLQEKPNFRRVIEAVKLEEPLPTDPADPHWQKVPKTDLRLSSNFYRQGEILSSSVSSISVQAVYNEEELIWRLTWNDPSQSRENPPDAVGLVWLPEKRMKWEVGSVRSWPAQVEGPGLAAIFWSADQRLARQGTVHGFEEFQAGKIDLPTVESKASYSEGQWSLLLQQPRQMERPALIGLAVWDGSNAEQGRHRSNSNWVEFEGGFSK